MRKILVFLISSFAITMFISGCGSVEPDYTTEEFEAALNEGEDLEGEIVSITVDEFEPTSAFGYNIQTGEHLNFVSDSNPDVEIGDDLVVEVEEVENVLGSFVISYKER